VEGYFKILLMRHKRNTVFMRPVRRQPTAALGYLACVACSLASRRGRAGGPPIAVDASILVRPRNEALRMAPRLVA
jgi:hypothetical protein